MRSSPIQVGSGFYRKIAAGNNSTMAVDPYGTLSAWGENLYGQAGTNTVNNTLSWTQLSNGDAHSLALRSDNTLWAWGLNTSGQLGVGNTVARQSPTQISGSWTQVSAGASHTIAINNDGVVYGWGLNTSGQVGDVTVISRSAPVQIPVAGPSSNYSNFFNGTTQYLRYNVNNNAAFNFGTNNFTIEAWVYPTVTSGTYVIINQSQTNASAGSTLFLGISANAATLQHASGATYTTNISGGTVTANTWTHIAGTRNGNTWTLWVNGISVGTNTDSTSVLQDSSHANAGGINIGVGFIASATTATSFFAGYISNARVVNGTALYTTGFYPSTGRFTTTSQNATAGQVSLLTAQSATIADNSSNAFAITNTGTVTVSGINPFGPYYSGSFTTTGQSLRIASNSAFDFGTGNFTIECWFYSTTVGTQVLIDRWNFGFSIFLLRLVGTSLQGFVNTTGGSSSIASTGPVTANTWNHAAFVRNGSIFTLYLNGASTGTPLNNALAMMTGTSVVSIGGNTSETIVGYMSDVRIVKGTAVYTGNFTPPGNILRTTQSAMTNIVALTGTETVLLTLQNATIIDNSVNAFTITNNGSVSITTSYAPFVGSATEYLIASKVAAGNNFTLAIRNDNTLYSWGLNTSYQLGNGTTTSRNNPGQVGTSSWSQISAGASHALAIDANNQLYGWGNSSSGQVGVNIFSWTQVAGSTGTGFAIRDDGSLWAWGLNSWGQLGQNDIIHRSSPVAIGTDSWLQVSSGSLYVLAIRSDNTLWSWGYNNVGQLGLDSIASRSSPVQVGTSSWSSVSAGTNSSLGIKTDTTLWAWGSNGTGQLGIGLTTSRSSPVQVSSAVTTWSVISISASIAAAISTSGGLYLWGLALANGTSVNRSSPVQLGTESWSAVATGLSSAIGIDTLGRLYSWGTNTNHQLGDNSALTVSRSSPVQLGASSWSIVSAGTSSSFAITTDSRLFAWGLNSSNQLGDGTAEPRSSPVQIGAGINFTKISSGSTNNSYAIDNNYYLYSWGNGSNGAIGDSTVVTKLIPTQVGGVNNNTIFTKPFIIGASSWSAVSAGYSHSVALTSDNQLFTWGNNTNGQLGFNMSFISISAGNYTTSVIRSDGTLWAWGYNNYGQLGDNTTVTRSSPVQVGTLINWSKTTRTSLTSYAIDNTGKLYAWGENSTGAIGDGTVIARSSPVQIGTSSWIMVATGGTGTAGQQTAYAIRSDGGLFAWGASNYGERGVGGAAFPLSPIQIGSSSWSIVSGGSQFAMAITSDGKLYGWGRNDAGQLGIALSTSTFTWSTINSSGTHTLALRSDNLLFAWGLNSSGQLGDGTTVNKSSPVQIASGSYTQISAGLTNSYAIRSDGSLWSWGSNTKGQLGDLTASTIGRSSPAQVGTDSWSLLSASQTLNYVLATRSDNTLYSWGDNTTSATGNYTLPSINNNVSSPVQVSGAGSWTQISAGGGHSLAINSDNKLYGWGLNNIGQTANNGSTFSWTQIASGTQHSLAIRSDGLLFAWGNNILGQLGNLDGGSGNNRSSPIQIGTSSWSQVSAADTFSLAIRNDNTLWAWGGNGSGFLGLNDTVNRSSPTQIGTATDWASVYTGQSNSFAIKSDSSLYAWGLNTSGMLGLGDTVNRSSPVQVATPAVSWSQVASGISFSGGIDTLGRLYTWGFNTQGQLGGAGNGVTTGNTISRSSPSQVGASSWSAIAAGQNAMIGIRNTGAIFTWGSNTLGELGNGSTITTTNRSSPVQVGTSSWSAVSARRGTVVALTTAGSLWAWGFNTQGQLGDNSTVAKSSMVAVAGGGTYTKISTGWKSLALTATTFNIVTWGRNDSGDLGIDNVANRSNPVQIGTNISTVINAPTIIGASSWTSVSAGASHSMAIRTDSGLFAWGFNTQGQLGDSTTVSRSSPVQVGTSSWTTVSAGTGHTMALRYLDGGLFTWGLGNPGQLGSGATASRSSPVQVGTSSWTSINSGASTGVAIDITNNIYAWGLGTSGQIGDNTIVTKSVPTKVGTFQSTIEYSPVQVGSSSWSQVSAGASHAVGIEIDNTVFAWGLNTSGQLGDNTVVSRSSPVQVGAVTNSLTNANAYSLSFNGTSQSLSISSNSAFTMNTGDFTFETYLYNSKLSWGYVPIFGNSVSGQSRIYTDAAGSLHLYNNDASVNIATIGTLASLGMSLNTWIHIAVVRISGVLKFYFNGVSAPLTFITGTGAESVDFINSTIGYVGTGPGSGSAYLKGYLSNLRLVKGTGVYTGNFTPSTIPLTAISGTSLLTAQNTNIVDNSTNAFTVTNNNSVSYSLNTPFTSAIEAGGLFVTQVSAGATHSVAIDSSSKLYGWGLNSSGQLGLSNIINRSAPTQIGLANNYNAISAGVDYTIALDNIGTLYAWGLGTTGQLGLSDAVTRSSSVQVASISIPNTSSPTQVGSNSYILVNAGNNISTAISSDSKLFVWGLGTTGQLGTGVTFSRSSPVQISTNSYNLVNAGGTHTTFVTNYSPQLILSTGLNTSGQLGQSSIISRSSPTQVAASATAFNTPVTVSTGDYSSYYVSSPTQVGTSSWTQVSAGGTHTLGVKYDNTLWAWGYNANGQLGGSNTINRSSPVQVGTSSWSQVSAGDSHNTIAKSDGTINTFGLNSFGQLGDGT